MQEQLVPPPRTKDGAANAQAREKEDNERVTRQKAALRLCAELAMVRVIQDGHGKSGGEWVMKTLRGLVRGRGSRTLLRAHDAVQLQNDPTLTSLPILVMFIKVFGRPYLGLTPATAKSGRTAAEAGTLSDAVSREPPEGRLAQITDENEELVEKEIRERFRRMCEGYLEKVGQKLVIEHNVSLLLTCYGISRLQSFNAPSQRLRDQDRRNHEAYIRSGEIFEDRQKAYEKMTQAYEKILTGCQTCAPCSRVEPADELTVAPSGSPSCYISQCRTCRRTKLAQNLSDCPPPTA